MSDPLPRAACVLRTARAAIAAGLVVSASPAGLADGIRRALLIGCTEFHEMQKLYGEEGYGGIRLRGPANDVAALRTVLIDQWSFDAARIAVLTGWDESAADSRPTRANIRAAFEKLVDESGRDDLVLVYLASHCPQLPVPPTEAEAARDKTRAAAPASVRTAERDGLDEVFLAADAGALDWENRKVANGVLDHEFATWLQRIRERGAFVVAIVNTPHAAGLLDTGPELLARNPGRDDSPKGQSRMKGLAALYACHADEATVEMDVAVGPADAQKPHGLLAWSLCEALRKEEARAWSYRQLFTAVADACQRHGGRAPLPASEGDLERPVFSLPQGP